MNKPPLQWTGHETDRPPRCLSCAYVLTGLDGLRCPECGRHFDPRDPRTYTTKPPFLAWKFWLPGFSLALIGASIGAAALLMMGNWGASLWFAVPFAAGSLLGYRFRSRWWVLGMWVITLVVSLCMGAVMLDIAGVYCGMTLAIIFMGPLFIGTVLGTLLRLALKSTRFSQRWHFPALVIVLIPIVCGVIEGRPPIHAPETVCTSTVFDASQAQSWDSIVFYEEVTYPPPLILRIGLARPLYTIGASSTIGDVKTCIYNKGRIVKKITDAQPQRLLAFEVIEQHIGYERDIALRGGKFEFETLDSQRTRVVLTTEYTPLLTPRWAWRPFETIAIHTLHQHVMEGMQQRAEANDLPAVAKSESRGEHAH
jgi:hypothetical protein